VSHLPPRKCLIGEVGITDNDRGRGRERTLGCSELRRKGHVGFEYYHSYVHNLYLSHQVSLIVYYNDQNMRMSMTIIPILTVLLIEYRYDMKNRFGLKSELLVQGNTDVFLNWLFLKLKEGTLILVTKLKSLVHIPLRIKLIEYLENSPNHSIAVKHDHQFHIHHEISPISWVN
jgi:hypothetical protein